MSDTSWYEEFEKKAEADRNMRLDLDKLRAEREEAKARERIDNLNRICASAEQLLNEKHAEEYAEKVEEEKRLADEKARLDDIAAHGITSQNSPEKVAAFKKLIEGMNFPKRD